MEFEKAEKSMNPVITRSIVPSAWLLGLCWKVCTSHVATCSACSTKILLDSSRVVIKYAKIKKAKEKLCWQGIILLI